MDLKALTKDLENSSYVNLRYYQSEHRLKELSGKIVRQVDIHDLIDSNDDFVISHIDGTESWITVFADGRVCRTEYNNGVHEDEQFLGKVKDWLSYAF